MTPRENRRRLTLLRIDDRLEHFHFPLPPSAPMVSLGRRRGTQRIQPEGRKLA